jgi:hypothetical protein
VDIPANLQPQDDIGDNGKKNACMYVVVPDSSLKRERADDWFPQTIKTKKVKLGNDVGDSFTNYFVMKGFPPMAHAITNYTKIFERKSYIVLFEQLMERIRCSIKEKSDSNIVVTENPGTEKSRLYLYCIFRFIRDTKLANEFSSFQLVLNYDQKYHRYSFKTEEFCLVTSEEVGVLQEKQNVIRLIEGKSSTLTGWKGISILFSSPGLKGIKEFLKVHSTKYILPVWSCEELLEYNSILDSSLHLLDELLVERYEKFGGIPRFIFENPSDLNDSEMKQAIASFDALKIIKYVCERC